VLNADGCFANLLVAAFHVALSLVFYWTSSENEIFVSGLRGRTLLYLRFPTETLRSLSKPRRFR